MNQNTETSSLNRTENSGTFTDIMELLHLAMDKQASDVFIIAGCPLSFKVRGQILPYDDNPLTPDHTAGLIQQLYGLTRQRSSTVLEEEGEDDFAFSVAQLGRFRVNAYYQRNSKAAVLRVVDFKMPNPEELHIPNTIMEFAEYKKGLVLITGSAGSGKSTTLACLIDRINRNRNAHIITIEDPIEFLHRHDKSIVSQREIGQDTDSYSNALRAALREAPDVILIGEMRDNETIQTALSAAETGHLVFSTLHTIGAANTVDRIIDLCPPSQQAQIRIQLSMSLQAVASQQLIPGLHNDLVPAFEIMKCNNAIRTQIREGKTHQIDNTILSNRAEGMYQMDASIAELAKKGFINKENALLYSLSSDGMRQKLL